MVNIEFNPNFPTKESAKIIFDFLGVPSFEERESSNFPPEETYFLGILGKLKIQVYAIDDSEHFTHRVSISVEDGSTVKKVLECLSAQQWQSDRSSR